MIQIVKRIFDILTVLHEECPLPLREIAQTCGLQKTTCHNILKSLVDIGIVDLERPGHYRLGPGLHHLTTRPIQEMLLREKASHDVERLAQESGETAIICTLHQDAVQIIFVAEGSRDVIVGTKAHSQGSLYFWSTGRLLLAHQPTIKINSLIERIGLPTPQEWPEAGSCRETFFSELAHIRTLGVLIRPATEKDILTMASPIYGPDQTVIAALGISIPSYRSDADMQQHQNALRKHAQAISQTLQTI